MSIFDYGVVSQLLIHGGNIMVAEVVLKVLRPFSSGAVLSVGPLLEPDLLMKIDQSNLLLTGDFVTNPNLQIDDSIYLHYSPGLSNQGQGLLYLYEG